MNLENVEEIEWRTHKKYNQYYISNTGKVKNIKTGLILKPFLNKGGYGQIRIRDTILDIRKIVRIHILVYETFMGERDDKLVIDHIDGNKLNNNILNLRETSISTNSVNRIKRKISYGINFIKNEIIIFDNVDLLQRKYNYEPNNVRKSIYRFGINKNTIFGIYNDKKNIFEDKINFCEIININMADFILNQDIYIFPKLSLSIARVYPKIAINIITNKSYIFRNVANFCSNFNLTSTYVTKVLRKERKSAGNFKFEYLDFFHECPEKEIVEIKNNI